jgi:hypothetical protein
MSPLLDNPARWRLRERRGPRRLAEQIADPEVKQEIMKIADE